MVIATMVASPMACLGFKEMLSPYLYEWVQRHNPS